MYTFCGREEETIQHLLWNCDMSQMFWNGLKAYPRAKFNLSEELIVFSVNQNTNTDTVIDLLILS